MHDQMRIAINKLKGNHYKIISKEVIDAILHDIAQGSPNKHACESHGISEALFYAWIQQGQLELRYQNIETLHTYLVESLRKIEKKEIIDCRNAIKSSDKGHKGAEWTLEHAYWRYFGSNAADIEVNERLERLEAQHGERENGEINCNQEEETSQK